MSTWRNSRPHIALIGIALFATACSNSTELESARATPVTALSSEAAPTTTVITTSQQQSLEPDLPAASARSTTSTSFLFTIDTEFEEEGLSVISGTFDAPDRLMMLMPASYPAHILSMHIDDISYEVSDTGWGLAMLPPDEFSDSAATHESLLAIFAPLSEDGLFTGTKTITVEETDYEVEYDFPVDDAGEIRLNDTVIEITINPEGEFSWPDPEELVLDVDDVVGATANPVVAIWIEAVQAQDQFREDRLAALPPATTTTTIPFAWIDAQDAVGGAILESPTSSGYFGESHDATLAIEPPSDCRSLDRFNSHKLSGFERVQNYDNSAYIERNGAYVTRDAVTEVASAAEIPDECPTITFDDGSTATTTAVTVGLPAGWSGFVLNFNDGSEVYYGFGGRERLISVVRLEHSPLASTEEDRDERLREYTEVAARRLNEAPSR